jgi:hypothetical protein
MSFHLAYLKLNTDFFLSGRPTSEKLQYALVPLDLSAGGPWYLERIDLNGRPMGKFPAMSEFLRTLRRPEVAPGTEDPMEQRLIEHVKGRALAAAHVLPEIVATQRTPGWSKLRLPGQVIAELQRLGGGGNG